MASAISTPPCPSHASLSPSIARKPTLYASLSTSQTPYSKNRSIRSLTWVPHLCLAQFPHWNGLRNHGLSISLKSLQLEKRKRFKGKGVFASLFGVGAPEALVIGVVALLVFGPKGLAEVAKNLGKTLRAFQPTIRELQEVSREFKSTLEKEIGLDELNNPTQGNYTSNTTSPPLSRSPTDTLQSTASPPATTTEHSPATAMPPAVSPEDSPAAATTPVVSPEDSPATTTLPAASPEVSEDRTEAPAVTMEDSQPTADPTNGSPSSKAYSSEDLLKITEEQLKAIQQKEQEPPSSPTPSSETPKTEI